MSRHHRTNRAGWDRIRKRAIAAAGRRCSRCGRPGRLEVHHPRPLADGGTHNQALEVTCRDCHLARHQLPDPDRQAWSRFLLEEFSHYVEVN